ncbi:hypothetical protein QR680_006950 [Steinernema hermaphroditum]|uniref:SCP domain-containing protein n=1 Tax=Steinernema hermaphroditum TaxID=289476 RepID=A0AA39LXY1_9BILA|nr:hypothetical protein QR680_006950 [Steinernema hermaphroditum]
MKAILIVGIALIVSASSINCPSRGLSPDTRKAMLDKHNELRSQNALGRARDGSTGRNAPRARNMYKLQWDCNLERIAQNWANRCQFQHSRSNLGENLYASGPPTNNDGPARDASASWWDELREIGIGRYSANFRFSNSVSSRGVGHYTQMAWARTTKLGCGHAKCSRMNIVVCNYSPAGNYVGQQIYIVGNPCQKDSDCTTYRNSRCSAKEGLCYIAGGRAEELHIGFNQTLVV